MSVCSRCQLMHYEFWLPRWGGLWLVPSWCGDSYSAWMVVPADTGDDAVVSWGGRVVGAVVLENVAGVGTTLGSNEVGESRR